MRKPIMAVLALLGCYNPEIPSGKFACAQDADCPEPLRCRPTMAGLRCIDPGPRPTGPCQGDGVQFGQRVWGCRGRFDAGGAKDLCREKGWRLCDGRDAALLALGTVCDSTVGFFAAEIPVERVREMSGPRWAPFAVDCDLGSEANLPWGLLGCGIETGARPVGVREGPCPMLPTALQCQASEAWRCAGDGLEQASYTGAGRGGVLCCRPE